MNQFQQSATPLFMKRMNPVRPRIRWLILVIITVLILFPAVTSLSAMEKHAGTPLAVLIEKNDCILRKDDQIAKKLSEAEISIREFQDQTAALFADGYLRSEEQGQVLRLVGWGDCESTASPEIKTGHNNKRRNRCAHWRCYEKHDAFEKASTAMRRIVLADRSFDNICSGKQQKYKTAGRTMERHTGDGRRRINQSDHAG